MENVTKEQIYIGIAELVVAHNPAVLITKGLGSCIAVSIRDPVERFGALAHIILPSIEKSNNKDNPLKFADSALEIAVQKLLAKGCKKNRLEAKIAGGASMFHFENMTINIGEKNAEAVMKKLGEMRIPIMASDIGGDYGRTVEFDIQMGTMTIKTAFHGVKVM
jgi:chemotaxis protein CheD